MVMAALSASGPATNRRGALFGGQVGVAGMGLPLLTRDDKGRNMSDAITPDSQHRGLVAALPARMRNYALLARFDRPIGWWLLFWPCAWGVLLAGGAAHWDLI